MLFRSAHLCAAVPNVSWMEIRNSPTESLGFYDERLFPVQPKQDGPRLIVPDVPGLGVEFDEKAASHEEFQPRARRLLRRRDGSVTNS